MGRCIKLFIKCSAVLLPLMAMIFYLSHYTLSFIDGEAPYYIWNKEVSRGNEEKYYDTIILGDSVANAAYLPEFLPGSVNLALGGTTPMENYYTLLDWLDHHTAPKSCYISYMDFHLQREDTFWTRSLYSHRYGLRNDLMMLRMGEKYNEPSILKEKYLYDFISYEFWLPNKYVAAFSNASINQREKSNNSALNSAWLHSGRYIGRSINEYHPNAVQTFSRFTVNPLFDDYYKKTIELCLANNIQVRLIKLPMPENCIFTDEYIATFYAYYDGLKALYPEITVDWFSLYDNGCFYDGHHMNDHGAMRFSTELKTRYPQDFENAALTGGQAAGIDDYICFEQDLPYLLDWMVGRDYTVILRDDRGTFLNVCGQRTITASDVALTVRKAEEGRVPEGENILVISCDGDEGAEFTVFRREDGAAMFQLGDGGPVPWSTVFEADLGVIVVDGYNNSIVCMKSFNYTESGFHAA